jgi:hypothetical protein
MRGCAAVRKNFQEKANPVLSAQWSVVRQWQAEAQTGAVEGG